MCCSHCLEHFAVHSPPPPCQANFYFICHLGITSSQTSHSLKTGLGGLPLYPLLSHVLTLVQLPWSCLALLLNLALMTQAVPSPFPIVTSGARIQQVPNQYFLLTRPQNSDSGGPPIICMKTLDRGSCIQKVLDRWREDCYILIFGPHTFAESVLSPCTHPKVQHSSSCLAMRKTESQ